MGQQASPQADRRLPLDPTRPRPAGWHRPAFAPMVETASFKKREAIFISMDPGFDDDNPFGEPTTTTTTAPDASDVHVAEAVETYAVDQEEASVATAVVVTNPGEEDDFV